MARFKQSAKYVIAALYTLAVYFAFDWLVHAMALGPQALR